MSRAVAPHTGVSLGDGRSSGVRVAGHTQIAGIQRARILSAMFDAACEHGAGNVSVSDVVERSGVSRRTFYEAFVDREDCFIAAFEEALGIATARVLPAYRAESKWCEQIRAALVALLTFLDEQPTVGRLLICESLAGGARVLGRREEVLALVTHVVDEGRSQTVAAGSSSPLTAEGLVGGVLSVLQARLARDGGEPLIDLAGPLTSMIVLPYFGRAAARRELERPIPTSPRGKGQHSLDVGLLSDPFKDAGMRLTYRTMCVIVAIAGQPGASNRIVGERAGISDQGQVSKLLSRLQRIGLVSNAGLAPGQGAPNAWSLTPKGRRIADSIRTYADRDFDSFGEGQFSP